VLDGYLEREEGEEKVINKYKSLFLKGFFLLLGFSAFSVATALGGVVYGRLSGDGCVVVCGRWCGP